LSTVFALGLLWSIGVDLGGDTLAQHLTGRPILGEGSSAPPSVTFGFDVSVGAGVAVGARVRVGSWVVVGDGSAIGDDAILHDGAVLVGT
jgi:UDP-3-O-[3-hydroxymyristoyl] glucosamine N-acyltransferase